MSDVTIAPPLPSDKEDWRRLYDGYVTFYKRQPNDEVADRVWAWIHDENHVLEALVAREPSGRLVGLAHFRTTPRPMSGTTAGFLDDLFVDPAARGRAIGERLIKAVAEEGRRRGWSILRWRTADDNYRARARYDKLATRTMWITYQIDL
ncbi:MAG: GNAT family N-acetyltransferase [Rhodospirillales bacterium]|nr:GNAT family N-acetyltransferase [Rhodospirillales bacterium]